MNRMILLAVLAALALLPGCSPAPQDAPEAAVERSGAVAPAPAPEAPSSEAPVAQDRAQESVFITESGAKYHRAACRYLVKSSSAISAADAQARGYTPCGVCKP